MKITSGLLLGFICIAVGTAMLVCLRGFFIFHPLRCFHRLKVLLTDRDRRKKLTLALAGTLGVGNIYGVAIGIIVGGAGSVFWLAVSSIFAIVIKYSESVVAVKIGGGQGMMRAIKETFTTVGRPLSVIYTLLMLALSLAMGAFIQAQSFISSAESLIPKSTLPSAILLVLLVLVAVLGGGEKIKSITEYVIPLVTLTYVLLSVRVILPNISEIPATLHTVILSAFTKKEALIGLLPVINTTAFSEGFARGILSNEAGVGTSSVAISEGESECSAGLFGMCEVVFDTLVLCMLTALAVLLTVHAPQKYSSPMALIFDAFRLGAGSRSLPILFLCIFFFAYSTIICWYYYGLACLGFLGKKRLRLTYLFVFLLSIMLAATLDAAIAVRATDLLLLLMSLPTCATILRSRRTVLSETIASDLLPNHTQKPH